MKIESWVPHFMDTPIALTFGRKDAVIGSSMEISKVIDFTINAKKIDVWVPQVMGILISLH